MNKTLLNLAAVITLVTTVSATESIVDKTKLQEIITKNRVLQDPSLTLKGVIEKADSYVLKLEARSPQGSQLIFAILDKQTSELYIGSAYDKEGKAITFPKDAKVVKEGVSFSYGKGSNDIYIVTDPECPYCSKFEQAIAGKMDDYTVHVILFPLSFHKKAPAMVDWIMMGKDEAGKKERFEEIMLKASTKYKELIKDAKKPYGYSSATQEQIEKSNKAAMELNVRGTPAIYDANFNPLSQDQLLKPKESGLVKVEEH